MLERILPRVVDPVEQWAALDRPAGVVRGLVEPLLRPAWLRGLLHGVPVGHPVHPFLAQSALGCFVGAALVDARGRPTERSAATALIAAGLVSAGPTAVAGLADWAQGHEEQQRVGIVHAATNTVGLGLYAASWLIRRRGGDGRGSAIAGLAALGVGGFLGGHLAFRQALGANHAEHVPHRVAPGWSRLCRVDELGPDGGPTMRLLGDQPLLVMRSSEPDEVTVISDVCPHLSGPLHEGAVRDGCVECPWHGSRFRLEDGSVIRGPATAPVPVFDVRLDGDEVLVRLPGAG